jgi:type I restriction enzyme R subunit
MALIARYTQSKPAKQKMTKEQLINLLSSSANLMEERDDIVAYINNLETGKGLTETEIREGYEVFKEEKFAQDIAAIAHRYGLQSAALKSFVDDIIERMIFDGEKLSELLAPLQLGWKDRSKKEVALMQDLIPQLKKLARGQEISGLKAYDV